MGLPPSSLPSHIHSAEGGTLVGACRGQTPTVRGIEVSVLSLTAFISVFLRVYRWQVPAPGITLLLGLPLLRPLSQEPHLRAVGKASVCQLESFPDGIMWPDSYVVIADGRQGQSNFRMSWLRSLMADRPWATLDPGLPLAPSPLEAWPGYLLGSRTRRSFQEPPSLEVCS